MAQITQNERTIGQTDQTVDLEAKGFEHLTHFAVLAFGQGDGDPQIGAAIGLMLGLVQHRFDGAIVDAFNGDAVL